MLSFVPLGLEWKLWIGLFGLLIPLALSAAARPSQYPPPPWKENLSLRLPVWFLAPAGLAAVLGRFTDLFNPGVFPDGDEALMQAAALDLLHHWRWDLFYTTSQSPPGLVWTEYLLGRAGMLPPASLWLPPAFFSTLAVGLGWAAARLYFSESFTWIFSGLLAFSYWGFFLGRFSTLPVWLPPWIFLTVILWGLRARVEGLRARRTLTFLAGLTLGLGWLTFTSWPPVTLFLAATFAWHLADRGENGGLPYLGTGLGLGLLPFLAAVARGEYGQHISSIALWGGLVPAGSILPNLLSNLTVLFWGSFIPGTYLPGLGGFLDPLSAAFFFTGLADAWHRRHEALVRWMAAALVLFSLPALLAAGLESSRWVQELPILVFFTALGMGTFLRGLPAGWRSPAFGLLIALIGTFNLGRLAAFPEGRPPNVPLEDAERRWVYHLLKAQADQAGPGWIFTHLEDQAIHNPAVSVMVYPFNAAENPGLSPGHAFPGQASWVGLVLDPGEVPFLRKRFPEGNWAWSDPRETGFRRAVGIIPVDAKDRAALGRWWRAYPYFSASDRDFAFRGRPPYLQALKDLEAGYPFVQGDPFLENRFWDKRADLEYQDTDPAAHLACYQMGLTLGDPTAELYLKYALLLRTLGRGPEARRTLDRARRAPDPAGNI